MKKITILLLMFLVSQNIIAQIQQGKRSSAPYMFTQQKQANQN
jgi:hypothetical protein